MKNNAILQKLEHNFKKPKLKNFPRVWKGDFVSVVYYERDNEAVRIQEFSGYCLRHSSPRRLNSKITLRGLVNAITVEQSFFLHSNSVIDVKILKL